MDMASEKSGCFHLNCYDFNGTIQLDMASEKSRCLHLDCCDFDGTIQFNSAACCLKATVLIDIQSINDDL